MTAIAIVIDVLALPMERSKWATAAELKRPPSQLYEAVAANILKFCKENKDIKTLIIHSQICVDWPATTMFTNRPDGLKNVPLLKESVVWDPANALYSNASLELQQEWALMNDEEHYLWHRLRQTDQWQKLEKTVQTTPFVTPASVNLPGTHKKLLRNKLRNDQIRMGCWTMPQLIYLAEQCHPEPVDTVYFFGGSLSQCLADRPIGYRRVANAIKQKQFARNMKILLKKDCVFDGLGQGIVNQTIDREWRHVQHPKYNDLYQLRF
jgi:hypothetical protein